TAVTRGYARRYARGRGTGPLFGAHGCIPGGAREEPHPSTGNHERGQQPLPRQSSHASHWRHVSGALIFTAALCAGARAGRPRKNVNRCVGRHRSLRGYAMAARPLVARQPNERLQALIQEAGCSNAGLARRVNMCGAEHGLDLRYDKTSVARWLRGQQPRGRAPAIIAEALGRKLGRTVTIDEIGMANGKNLASGVGLQFSPTVLGAIERVCELWRSDVGRRDFLSGSSVAASALVEPSRDWLISLPDAQVARSAGPRVGRSDVAAVRSMTQALVD